MCTTNARRFQPSSWIRYLEAVPPDSSETKRRLLEAASGEFSRYGLAGARVDRIAQNAQANKQAIYAHFGSKDQLFDRILDDHVRALVDAVPFTPDDLAGYAGATFDHLTEHPDLVRLTMWRYLERGDEQDPQNAVALMAEKARAVGDQQRDGRVDATADPLDLMVLVLALSTAWTLTAPALVGFGPDPIRIAEQRALVVSSAARLIAPQGR
jgi:AcrR family transcriptional regulator